MLCMLHDAYFQDDDFGKLRLEDKFQVLIFLNSNLLLHVLCIFCICLKLYKAFSGSP